MEVPDIRCLLVWPCSDGKMLDLSVFTELKELQKIFLHKSDVFVLEFHMVWQDRKSMPVT